MLAPALQLAIRFKLPKISSFWSDFVQNDITPVCSLISLAVFAGNEEAIHRPMFCRLRDIAAITYHNSSLPLPVPQIKSYLSSNNAAVNALALHSFLAIRIELTSRVDTVLYGAVKISRRLEQKGDSPQREDSLWTQAEDWSFDLLIIAGNSKYNQEAESCCRPRRGLAGANCYLA